MNKNIIQNIFSSLFYIILQIVLLRNFVLFGYAFCFIYVAILLFLPLNINTIAGIFIGFVVGLTIDIFYDTLGIHAASCVLLMFIRPWWAKVITSSGNSEDTVFPHLRTTGIQWFITYVLPLTFIFHFALFYIEIGTTKLFFYTLFKVLASTFSTFIILLAIEYLFYSPSFKHE